MRVYDSSGLEKTASSGGGGAAGISRIIQARSAGFAAGASALTDYVYLCSATLTATLPTAVGNTNSYEIKNVGAGVISVATTSGQTIEGSASPITIPLSGMSLTFYSDGANWVIA